MRGVDAKTSTEMKGHTAEVSGVRWDPTHPEHLASCSAATGAGKSFVQLVEEARVRVDELACGSDVGGWSRRRCKAARRRSCKGELDSRTELLFLGAATLSRELEAQLTRFSFS